MSFPANRDSPLTATPDRRENTCKVTYYFLIHNKMC